MKYKFNLHPIEKKKKMVSVKNILKGKFTTPQLEVARCVLLCYDCARNDPTGKISQGGDGRSFKVVTIIFLTRRIILLRGHLQRTQDIALKEIRNCNGNPTELLSRDCKELKKKIH